MYSRINIGLAIDKNYFKHFFPLVFSIFSNVKKRKVYLYLIVTDIKNEEINEMKFFVKRLGGNLTLCKWDESLLNGISIPESSQFTRAIFYRLLFPLIIDDSVKKLIYIDSDVLAVGDIGKLFETELKGKVLAAVCDAGMQLRVDLGLNSRTEYFNSGMLLIDIVQWRNQMVTDRCLSYIRLNHNQIDYPDQDALNFVLKNNWLTIDQIYNLQPEKFPSIELDEDKLNEYLQDKILIHFSGFVKPWSILPLRLKTVYTTYFQDSQHYYNHPDSPGVRLSNIISLELSEILRLESDIVGSIKYGLCIHLSFLFELKRFVNNKFFNEFLGHVFPSGSEPKFVLDFIQSHFNGNQEFFVKFKNHLLGVSKAESIWLTRIRESLNSELSIIFEKPSCDDKTHLLKWEIVECINQKLSLVGPFKASMLYHLNYILVSDSDFSELRLT